MGRNEVKVFKKPEARPRVGVLVGLGSHWGHAQASNQFSSGFLQMREVT